ncbi:S1C family serine protease [Halegenticoccus soli]|uniref:S1C family serine protease n=1 Tax=Halegenticoccus soli TaxID=1985678 RepID=UPI000C6DC593|nr:trypsin-like peptidase domain-containing protein [Halegenticoccus soli]
MDSDSLTRRRYLGLAAAVAAGTAGCSGSGETVGQTGTNATADRTGPATADNGANASSGEGTANGEGSVYTRLYREIVGSVVQIRAPGGGLGSGFVYGEEHVVTNYHVVTDADRVDVLYSRGQSVTGTVVGTDAYSDLAVVRVRNRPDYAAPLPLAETEPQIGTEVAVIGSPFGLEGSLTSGIVSGVDRLIPSPAADFRIPNAIQTDASVNPGNSGGPLVNLDGVVQGVVNSGGGENIAFAISAPLVRRVVPALIRRGRYRHPYLGVQLIDVTEAVARANDLRRARGLLVVGVLPGAPAEGELRGSDSTAQVDGFSVPTGGDVVLAVDGRRIESVQDFYSYLALNASPGETITLTVLRDGERRQVRVELGARPPPQA